MSKSNGGCAFGKVSRNMIDNLNKDFVDFRGEIRNEFKELKKTNEELYNHLSDRLPRWAVIVGGILLTIFSAIIGALTKGIF